MAYELVYTSAEKGLRPGTRGFCTVAHTRGMPPQYIQLLEALSAYKGLRSSIDNISEMQEPVAWSHLYSSILGRGTSIVSRIGAAHPDHTGRSNKLAHHVICQSKERAAAGPAWLCQQPGFLLDEWDEAPHLLETQKDMPQGDATPAPAQNWAELTGDAGNAAILPDMFLGNPEGIVIILFLPGMELLPLIAESLALLPEYQRWKVTFNTYFSTLPAGSTCCWRCCLPDSDAYRDARRNPKAKILDLTGVELKTPTGALAEYARTGHLPEKKIVVPVQKNAGGTMTVNSDSRNINMLTLKPRKRF